MTGEVLIETNDYVLTVTFSNPTKRNAISREMYEQLDTALSSAASNPKLKALVLRGAEGSFAGGTDIGYLSNIHDGADGVKYEAWMAKIQQSLLSLRIPVLSVVHGACVGGGLVFAALSDIVYCTPDAKFGSPIARTIGNTLSATSIARLRACVGPRLTMEMLLTARLITADEANDAGLVNAVFSDETIEAEVTNALRRIALCSPSSLWSFKELERRLDRQVKNIEVEDVYSAVYGGPDFKEGVTAFLEKRAPRFGGVS